MSKERSKGPNIRELLKRFNFHPGLNKLLFQGIKEQVPKWSRKKKYCSIVFDMIELSKHLDYDSKLDQVLGYVHLPGERKALYASHALVFLISGAVIQWSQHVAVYFCEKTIPKDELKLAIKEVVIAVADTGLIPIALVTTQHASFQAALKDMQFEHRKSQIVDKESKTVKGLCKSCCDDSININGIKLNIIYDPRHLLKGVRNHFSTKNMLFAKRLARWYDIVQIYRTKTDIFKERSEGLEGFFSQMSEDDVIPNKIKKDKIGNCVRVFSITMAGLLYFRGKYEEKLFTKSTMLNTSRAVEFFDELFDSVNGEILAPTTQVDMLKEIRCAITQDSPHNLFWAKAIKRLKSIQFVDKYGNKIKVATFQNWITTIKSFQSLYARLQLCKINAVRPRYFTTDPIDTFFIKIRVHNGKKDLTCKNFLRSFKILLLTDSDIEKSDSDESFKSFENYMKNNVPNYDDIDIFAIM